MFLCSHDFVDDSYHFFQILASNFIDGFSIFPFQTFFISVKELLDGIAA